MCGDNIYYVFRSDCICGCCFFWAEGILVVGGIGLGRIDVSFYFCLGFFLSSLVSRDLVSGLSVRGKRIFFMRMSSKSFSWFWL